MTMNRLGVKEDNFEPFMSDVYSRSKNLGLTPESIASYFANLIEFSRTVPFSQIPGLIWHKGEEKIKLEEEIQNLEDQIKILKDEKSTRELRRILCFIENCLNLKMQPLSMRWAINSQKDKSSITRIETLLTQY